MYDLVIKNAHCINPEASFTADLAIQDGKIIRIDSAGDLRGKSELDATGKLVFPGLIDTHVHLPWPSVSFDSVDDFDSGTCGAVFGGVTTIIEYVVPDESGQILPALEKQVSDAEKTAHCDFSFHIILRKITSQTLDEMAVAVSSGLTSFKIYTAYPGFRLEDLDILTCLQRAKEIGALVCFHAEDGVLVNYASQQLASSGKTQIKYYPQAHPRLADVEATFRVISYARQLGARIHIVHVNTQEGMQLIQQARAAGDLVTGETCPQYLNFTDAVYKTGCEEASYFILSPVIREESDRLSLWQALADDALQTIATDHCPYTREQKVRGGDDFRSVPGGAGGIETSLPLVYTKGVLGGKFSLNRMVEVMSTNPAKIFNLYPRKGTIAVGSDADLVIFDPNTESSVINAANLHSNMDHTIYAGLEVQGKVDTTILRGQLVVHAGQLVSPSPSGILLRRPRYV